MQLLPVPAADASGVVRVPRGWLYEFCAPGVAGTVREPCEPGAHAWDTEDGNLVRELYFAAHLHAIPLFHMPLLTTVEVVCA